MEVKHSPIVSIQSTPAYTSRETLIDILLSEYY